MAETRVSRELPMSPRFGGLKLVEGFNNKDLSTLARIRSILDILVVLLSFLVVHKLYLENIEFSAERLLIMVFAATASYAILNIGGLYKPRLRESFSIEVVKIALCWFIVALTVGLFAFLTKVAGDVSRVWFIGSMISSLVVMIIYRAILYYSVAWSRTKGHSFTSVVIAGAGEIGQTAANLATEYRTQGYRVEGIFGELDQSLEPNMQSLLGSSEDLPRYIESMRKKGKPIEQVWIARPMAEEKQIQETIDVLEDSSVDVCIIPSILMLRTMAGSTNQVGDMAVVNISDVTLPSFGEWYKAFFDMVVATVAVIFLLPVMAVIAVLIKFDSKGPVLFRQSRYGVDGQEIEIWKFRSMTVQENGDKVVQASRHDARVTKLGKFLRKTSLDELPQFFNVLQGTMSLVGPRPHAVAHNEEYRAQISRYMMRHKIKPGITGLAQINGWRGETDTLDKMENRIHHDLEYIRTWSPWLDIKIMVLTVVRGFTGDNAY